MNNRLFYWSLTAALAGFLFGFDTVVISGAEKTIQNLWSLDNATHGLAIGMALWRTVLGSLVGGWPTNKFGRKNTLISIGALYFVSAIWSGLATDVYSFMVARFIGGLGVGISTVTAPLYISEIAPPDRRGRLAGMFQFNIVFGILIAFLSNYLIGRIMGEGGWRWMLGIEAVPALIYTVMCFTLPQSPRWLIATKGDRAKGEAMLALINEDADQVRLKQLADDIENSSAFGKQSSAANTGGFWTARLRVPILLAFLVAFFNQLSGINAVLYFAPRIFQLAGFGENAALLNSIGIGVTNLLFTFAGLYLIDRLGRRTLLYIGSFGYIVSLGVCTWAFFSYAPPFQVANSAINVQSTITSLEKSQALDVKIEKDIAGLTDQLNTAQASLAQACQIAEIDGDTSELTEVASFDQGQLDQLKITASNALIQAGKQSSSGGYLVVVCIFAFIAAHAIGQGAVIWVLISEIFPNRHRAAGQSLGSFTHWIFAAGLTTAFPWLIGNFAPGYVFGLFCFMMVLQLIWVAAMVPETKGVALEDMEKKLGIG